MDSEHKFRLTRIIAKILAGTVHVIVMVCGAWIMGIGLNRLVQIITYKWDK